MRTLKDIAPSYQGKLRLVLIAIDPSEPPRDLKSWQESNGYPGTLVLANEKLLDAYKVLIRSTKIGIDHNGAIVFRAGYGEVPKGSWEATVQFLTG